jgi:hypothetical protein
MRKLTVLYSPQCPSNAHFIREMGEWSRPYGATVEAINVFEDYEKALKHLENTPFGHTKNLFIAAFIDGRWIPGHPGNPQFKEDFMRALEESQ